MINKLKIRRILFILVPFVFCFCTRENKENNIDINIDPNLLHKDLNLSEVFKSIEFLQLETNKNCLLGLVQKVKVSNSRYYFLTGFTSERIIIFGKDSGNHLFTIDKNGRGPGEYNRALDLYVDPDDQFFEIYSRGLKKIIRYNNEGMYLFEENIERYLNSFTRLNQNLVLYADNQLTIERDNKVIDLIELNDYSIGDNNNFCCNNGSISFCRSIDNKIYKINSNGIQIKYNINFGRLQIPSDYFQENFDQSFGFSFQNLFRENYAYNIFSFYESSSLIVLTIVHNNSMHLAVYSKETGQIKIADDFINDLQNLKSVFKINREMIPVSLDGNELLFIIEPIKIKEWVDLTKQSCSIQEWEIFKRKNESLIQLYDRLEENNNPVIAKCKLKRF